MFLANTVFAQMEPISVPLSDPNKPGVLEIGIINGSIKVMAYAGKEVMIESSMPTPSSTKPVEKNGMKRISSSDNYGLNIEESKNKIEIGVEQPNKKVNLLIKVPRKFNLQLSVINGGDIVIEGVHGSIEASNINGAVKMNNIVGDASVNTVNGTIFVDFDAISPQTPMAFTTINGKIEIVLPASTNANLKFQTDRGEVYSDFDMEMLKSTSVVKKNKENGVYNIIKEGWSNMKINSGGSEFMLKSMNGDIYIKKGK